MPTGLNERTRGWLRFLWDKTTTRDDWSSGGTPHPWWDRDSSAPMCAFPRFDLAETAYVLPVLADQTPAWREVYTRMADEIVGRHTTFWAAIDWLTLIGHDPDPDRYPPEWLAFLPGHLQGRYDPPGWTANGAEPWGLQPDPIGSDGNLFFRGFFNLILSIYRYVSGDEKWTHGRTTPRSPQGPVASTSTMMKRLVPMDRVQVSTTVAPFGSKCTERSKHDEPSGQWSSSDQAASGRSSLHTDCRLRSMRIGASCKRASKGLPRRTASTRIPATSRSS